MRLAIMQPYLFPYIGYFQLAAAADRFVFYDDVVYIKNGWINRNRWRLGDREAYFTVPLRGASPSQPINAVALQRDGAWRRKLMQTLPQAYGRAPHFEAVEALFKSVIGGDFDGIGAMAKASVMRTAQYLGLATAFVDSSAVYGNAALRGPARVLDICAREGAAEYLNLPGGRALYDAADFAAHGIALRFVEPALAPYRQGGAGFVAGLSIIDLLMHEDVDRVRARLGLGARAPA